MKPNFVSIFLPVLFFLTSSVARAQPFQLPVLGEHGEQILTLGSAYKMALSPDENTLATISRLGIFFWDLTQERPPIVNHIPGDYLSTNAWNIDLRYITESKVIVADQAVSIFNPQTSQLVSRFETPNSQYRLISHDGETVFVLAHGYLTEWKIQAYDTATGALRKETVLSEIPVEAGFILPLALSPDQTKIFVGGYHQFAFMIDTDTLEIDLYYEDAPEGVVTADFSPDGKSIVGGTPYGWLLQWDTESGRLLKRLSEHLGFTVSLRFTPDGKRVIASHANSQVDFVTQLETDIGPPEMIEYDVQTGKKTKTIPKKIFNSEMYFRNGHNRFVGLDESNFIAEWDMDSGEILHRFGSHFWIPISEILPDNRRIASLSSNLLFDITTRTATDLLPDGDKATFITYSPHGRYFVTGDDNGIVRIRNAEDTSIIHTIDGHLQRLWGAAFSDDNRLLATSSPRILNIWDVEQGTLLHTIDETNHPHGSLVGTMSPVRFINNYEICFFNSSFVEVWTMEPLEQVKSIPIGGGIRGFTPDGQFAYVTSPTGLQYINLHTEEHILISPSVRSQLESFHPNGELVTEVRFRVDSRLHSLKTGESLFSFPNSIWAEFIPNGQSILTLHSDGTLRLWDTDKLIQQLTTVDEFSLHP